MDKTEFLNLLTRNEQSLLVKQLLREFPDQPVLSVTRPVPIQNIRSIYRLRSERNESLGAPIKGFPELVQGLYDFSGASICIYSIDSDTVMYKVFADAAQEEFAGILKFPQTATSKAALFQSELQTA